MDIPRNALLEKSAYDPLRQNCADLFWYHVEPSFAPFSSEDVSALTSLAPKRLRPSELTVPALPKQAVKDTEEEAALARMRSFPVTQRLFAALLDDGKGATSASRALRQHPTEEPTWLPGSLPALRNYNRMFEKRVKAELKAVGLFDADDDDELCETMRMDQWQLRNLATSNSTTHQSIVQNMSEELKTQTERRERKRRHDQIEVQYLEKMMETGGKRGRSRFSKLLGTMHPNRNLTVGAPLPGSGRGGANCPSSDPSTTHDRKKKKKKSYGYSDRDRVSKKNVLSEHTTKDAPSTVEESGAIDAPHIAEIIWRYNNSATLDEIVSEVVKNGANLDMDESEIRTKISKMISFSRKPFRFPKHHDKKTYSAVRVT